MKRYRLHCTVFWIIWLTCVAIIVVCTAFVATIVPAAVVFVALVVTPALDLYNGRNLVYYMPWLGDDWPLHGINWIRVPYTLTSWVLDCVKKVNWTRVPFTLTSWVLDRVKDLATLLFWPALGVGVLFVVYRVGYMNGTDYGRAEAWTSEREFRPYYDGQVAAQAVCESKGLTYPSSDCPDFDLTWAYDADNITKAESYPCRRTIEWVDSEAGEQEESSVKADRTTGIYHERGDPWYARTHEDVVCYESAYEARDAGYRAPLPTAIPRR